jgi:hypothetical protein
MRLMSRLDDERKSGAILVYHFPAIALTDNIAICPMRRDPGRLVA